MEEKASNILKSNFDNINAWLSFAEAKNAANIAFIVACVAAIMSSDLINIFAYLIMIMFIISGVISLLSFIPNLKTNQLGSGKRNNKSRSNNLLFFDAIKDMSGEMYLECIYRDYLKREIKDFDKYELDLANECVVNSRIASMKYIAFKHAVIIDFIAMFIALVLLIVA